MEDVKGTPRAKRLLVQLKIVITMALSHFETPGIVDEKRIEQGMAATKEVLLQSQSHADVRLFLALSKEIWMGLTDVLRYAVPALERLSLSTDNDSSAAAYNPSVAGQISPSLASQLRDIDYVNDLCIVGRNMLATEQVAQDMAAEAKLDQHMLKLIDLCNRVAAQGYDREATLRPEERWQKIVNAYKKLLVTSLQFLHNLIMNNERRKLLLWMDLFGNSPCADSSFMGRVDPAAYFPPEDYAPKELLAAGGPVVDRTAVLKVKLEEETSKDGTQVTSSAPNTSRKSSSEAAPKPTSLVEEVSMSRTSTSQGKSDDDLLESPIEVTTLNGRTVVSPHLNEVNFAGLGPGRGTAPEDDVLIACTPAEAAENLQFAKEQLVDRLFSRRTITDPPEGGRASSEGQDEDDRDDTAAVPDAAARGSVGDDDEAYPGNTDQERGLLTDIPLLLGPSEIEALPMIVQAGILDAQASKNLEGIHENMQAIRCNILISQESGRNLLRELLIFIAAWDLGEEQTYFGVMLQIMEAVLVNGLVPFTYRSFAETKDIISPAQAVMIKLITHIFRDLASRMPSPGSATAGRSPALRVHVLAIRFLFAHFRQSVIPETCGLIYLQGQIRRGQINAEDFPLNFWDMERVYEGTYQFLEFLAVLTEVTEWKYLLMKWEVTFELVVLLKELEAAIPKGHLSPRAPTTTASHRSTAANDGYESVPTSKSSSALPENANVVPVVSVERPFDPDPPSPPGLLGLSHSPDFTAVENPQEFEWRNLKKLIILVLSSLTWRSAAVQNQVRVYGGVEAVLQCCNYDGNNLYIREHAIMCLRFLLEDNEQNMKIVRDLERRQTVPAEVLDDSYETVVDDYSKVGLRRKTTAD